MFGAGINCTLIKHFRISDSFNLNNKINFNITQFKIEILF